MNAAESGDAVNITGAVAGEYSEGDAVTLTVNGTAYTGAVAVDGSWTIAVAGTDLAAASSLDVSVTTADAAGNSTTTTASHAYGVDTTAPELSVSVDPITSDNVINAAESGAETIAVTGAVAAESGTETAITVTVNGQQYTATVDAAAGTWTVAVATSDLLADSSVAMSATSTDAAGNATTATATHGYSVDTIAPDLTVSVDPITSDNVINAAESGASVDVTGAVSGEFNEGDAVTLRVNDVEYTGVVAADGSWTIAVAGSDLAATDSLTVSVTTTDAAGNGTTQVATHSYGVDTTAPELTVSVDSITADNVINAVESGAAVDVTGAVAGEFNEGDTVTLTINGTKYTGAVGEDGAWTIAVAGSDLAAATSLDVSVTTTDAAGNSTTVTSSHSYGVDTIAPELTVSVDPVTTDNVINIAESGAETIAVTGAVTAEAGAETTVTVTINGQQYAATVDVAAGTWTVDVATDDLLADSSVAVSATSTDTAGNATTTTATHGYSVDVEAPELTVLIDPITSDNVINAAESGAAVDVTGSVSGEFNEGDAVTLAVNGTEYTGAVSADGTWTMSVAGSDLAASDSLDVSVTTTDAAGNSTTTTATHDYSVDTDAPELTVSVDSITSDNVLNAAESGAAVNVTGTVDGEFNEGDTVTLMVNGTEYTGAVAADGAWVIPVAGSDLAASDSLAVSVTTTDAAGNATTTTTTHGYLVDTKAPELTISVDSITSDNVINAAESGAERIAVAGAIIAEAGAETTITVTVNGQQYVATVDAAAGTWTVDVATSDLLADSTVAVSATSTDAAGNATTTATTHSYGVDTTAPELTVSVDSITSDNVVNAAESGGSVDVMGAVAGEFNEGDAVTLTVNGVNYTGAVAADGSWAIAVAGSDLAAATAVDVSVTTTDAAGNSTTQATTHSYGVDTTAPELTVSVDSITSDNVINAAESGAAVNVTGAVDGEFNEGDTVTLTVNDTEYTGAVAADGAWVIAVAGSDLAASGSLAVSVTTIDAAGNATTTTTTHDYSVDTTAPELTVAVDPITSDNVINAAESGASVDVTGAVAGEFNEGDAVTLTVNGTEYTGAVAVDGSWVIAVAGSDLAASDSLGVSVTTTDAAGNSTTQATTHNYGVDTTAPELAVSVDSITSDNVINIAESGAETIAVTGVVVAEAGAETTVTVTINGQQYTATVDAAAGTWTVAVATSDLLADSSVAVSATSTDAAGNATTATATHGYSVDTEAPELAISVDSITADNVINAAESGAAADVTGSVSGEFNEGDTVTLTINGTEYTGAVGEDGAWTIAVAGSDLAAATSLDVSVTTTDAAGNSTMQTTTHSYGVDTTAPELTVTIDPISGDNYLDRGEAASTVTVTGRVNGEINGETSVQVTVGSHVYAAVLAQDGSWSVSVPGDQLAGAVSVQATATSTDAAGNVGGASAAQAYEVQPPNEVPTAAGGMVQGVEDTALVLGWDQFNVSDDSPAGDQGIVITGLPADGVLQINMAAPGETPAWTTIQLADGRYEVSRADIEAGQLRFVPDAHESGWDASAGEGVGNNQADYAHIVYRPTDGELEGAEATLVVDVAPVADAPVVSIEVGATDTVHGSAATYGLGDGIVLSVVDGVYTATGLNGGKLLLPPFADQNINPNDVTHKQTDIIALVGDFSDLMAGGQSLHLINGDVGRDYVFLSKDHDQYVLSNLNTNHGRLNVTVTDLATGESVQLVNVKGLIYGDGYSTGNISVDYQADASYNQVALTVHADLVDLDGSETLSGVTLTGIPAGVTVEGAVLLPNGDWYVANPDGLSSLDLSLALRVPEGTETFTVTALAGSTEYGVAAVASGSAAVEIGGGPVNEVPTATGGTVEGSEDTALVLDWSHFNVSDDSPAGEQGILITGLPADGALQFNTGVSGSVAVWTQVELVDGQYRVSRADIEAGRLRFVPADDESGSDVYGGSGVGDQQADYAQIVFRPTDGANTGDEATLRVDIAPVADAPEVNVTLTRTETASDGGGATSGSDIIQVNGGSGVPGGFDVQDGKIVRIGDGVRVWLTEGDTAPEAADPGAQIRYYTQGNHSGDADYADIYVVHSQSGWFYRQSDWPADRKELRDLDSVGGNREQNAVGDKDYIFVQSEDGYSYGASHSTNNNNATHVNTLDGVRVTYNGPNGSGQLINQVSNNLEGVIFGNGSLPHLADPNGTTLETVSPSPGVEVSYEIAIQAAVTDTDGSEFLGDLLLGGIPAGATVSVVGDMPDGLSLVQAGDAWVLRWAEDAGSRQTADVVLKVTDVPDEADFTGVTVHAVAHEAHGASASATGVAVLDSGGGSGAETPEGAGEPGAGDPGDGGAGAPAGDFSHTGTDLLINGDFSQMANANEYGWAGNNDAGYTAWTHTGPFLDHKWMMTGSSHSSADGGPYVGAWNNDTRDITLSQDLSGVPAGSVLQLDVAWNNPNNGIPGDPYNAPKDTGNSMRLEISFGGVVYAVIATPEAGTAVEHAGFATVTAMNGAAVDIDRIETWSYEYSTAHGNDDFHPEGLTGFQTLQIQLPADAPADGALTLHWDPQSEGSSYTDDLMVANLHLYAGDGSVDTLSSPLVDDGEDFGAAGAAAATGDEQPPAGGAQGADEGPLSPEHVLLGTSGNDVFEWSLGDGGGDGGVTHDVIRDFGTGDNGQGHDVLDLRDLLVGEQDGDLTQYLHFTTALNDQGQADTVIHVQTQGGLAADGSGYNHQITIENVDLVGSVTDQAQLIQNLIQEGRLKVDQ
nr:Ig-like domain-containing protein [Castellaniella sp. S9]